MRGIRGIYSTTSEPAALVPLAQVELRRDIKYERYTRYAGDFYSTTNRTNIHEYLVPHAECAENAEFTPHPPSLRLSSP